MYIYYIERISRGGGPNSRAKPRTIVFGSELTSDAGTRYGHGVALNFGSITIADDFAVVFQVAHISEDGFTAPLKPPETRRYHVLH
jgi:hypothetical protein